MPEIILQVFYINSKEDTFAYAYHNTGSFQVYSFVYL